MIDLESDPDLEVIAIENGSRRYFVTLGGVHPVSFLCRSFSKYCYFFCLFLAFPKYMGRCFGGDM